MWEFGGGGGLLFFNNVYIYMVGATLHLMCDKETKCAPPHLPMSRHLYHNSYVARLNVTCRRVEFKHQGPSSCGRLMGIDP